MKYTFIEMKRARDKLSILAAEALLPRELIKNRYRKKPISHINLNRLIQSKCISFSWPQDEKVWNRLSFVCWALIWMWWPVVWEIEWHDFAFDLRKWEKYSKITWQPFMLCPDTFSTTITTENQFVWLKTKKSVANLLLLLLLHTVFLHLPV